MMRRHCIMIVDDEPLIRSSLSRLVHREGFDSLLAENADDAWMLFRTREISAIFSDHVIPGEGGLALLSRVKQKYPRIVRVLLSGHPDQSAILEAIKKKVVSHFIMKPWGNEAVRKTLYRAVTRYNKNLEILQVTGKKI